MKHFLLLFISFILLHSSCHAQSQPQTLAERNVAQFVHKQYELTDEKIVITRQDSVIGTLFFSIRMFKIAQLRADYTKGRLHGKSVSLASIYKKMLEMAEALDYARQRMLHFPPVTDSISTKYRYAFRDAYFVQIHHKSGYITSDIVVMDRDKITPLQLGYQYERALNKAEKEFMNYPHGY